MGAPGRNLFVLASSSVIAILGAVGGVMNVGIEFAPVLYPSVMAFAASFGASRFAAAADRISDAEDERNDEIRRGLRNADVHRLMGRAIALALRVLAKEQNVVASTGKLRKLADGIEKNWGYVEEGTLPAELRENNIADYYGGDAKKIKAASVLDRDQWREILTPIAAEKELLFDDGEWGAIGGWLAEHYTRALYAATKTAAVTNDPAWPALLLRLMAEQRELLAHVSDQSAEFREALAEIAEASLKSLQTLITATDRRNHARYESVFNLLKSESQRIREGVAAVWGRTNRANEQLKQILSGFDDILQGIDSIKKDTQEILQEIKTPKVTLIIPNLGAPPHYVDRHDLILKIHNALCDAASNGRAALTAASGDGGQGKTYLAEAYARAHRHGYPGGIVIASVAGGRSLLAGLAGALVRPVGVEINDPEAASLARELLMRGEPSLLILDNVEDKAHWSALRTETLGAGGNRLMPGLPCRVLVTSRVADLADCDKVHVDKFSLAEAVSLWRKLSCRDIPSGVDWDAVEMTLENAASGAKALETFLPEVAAMHTIWRELEGLAALMHAVGVKMSRSKRLAWPEYAERVRNASMSALPDGDQAILNELQYDKKVYRVLLDYREALHPAERRCLEYAALLPQDAAPRLWLAVLLMLDADPGGVLAESGFGPDAGGEERDAFGVLEDMLALESLRLGGAEGRLLTAHSLHRRLARELLEKDAERTANTWACIIKLAASRAHQLVAPGEVDAATGVHAPPRWLDPANRWEVEALAMLCREARKHAE